MQKTIKVTAPIFTMNCNTFDKLLEHNNIRWFDIVLYNYIKDKAETYGAYDEAHQEYDRETKTTSRYKDKFGLIITDLQLSKVLRVKGNDDTAKKEISRSLKRLETAGAIKREYIKMESKTVKETRIIVPLL
jgi:tetratricopeptide (TPR) repeat protein